jgi:hypothetical protein
MAKVPVYNDLQVAPSNVAQVQYAQSGNPYSGLAQGLQQAGQGVQQFGENRAMEAQQAAAAADQPAS